MKTLDAAKLLLKDNGEARIYLLTGYLIASHSYLSLFVTLGAVMAAIALREADLKPVAFQPKHTNKLGNDFRLYVNAEPSSLVGPLISEHEWNGG